MFNTIENDVIGFLSYINNYEIENYFLKAVSFFDKNSYSTLGGSTFTIKKTELNGDYKIMTRNLY